MDQQLEQLKEQYSNIPIPPELDMIVNKAIQQRTRRKRLPYQWAAGVAAASIVFIAGLNMSPTFAKAMSEIPVIGSLVKVLTFKEYTIHEETSNVNIQIPAITNLENKPLQDTLNQKYLEESKKLYDEFTVEIERLKQNGGGQLGVNSGYVVKTDTEQILSIGRYVVNTVGSSSTTFKYDTIDKKKQLLLTLPSLFKDDSYLSLISENIKEQMRSRMKEDPKQSYWVAGSDNKVPSLNFESIKKDQTFYITADGKLVISFDKYAVAPGYMGIVEFVIPTSLLSDALVSKDYIK